jgi:hypothetical protein
VAFEWYFRDYVTPGRRNVITDWYKKVLPQVRADFDELIGILETKREWQRPEFKRLKGKQYRGLGELRWNTGKVEYRVFGCNGPGTREYTLLLGCTHKGRVYDPPDALDTATQRMKAIKNKQGSTYARDSEID